MTTTPKSLWPEKIGVERLPSPVRMLREQGVELNNLTGGKLYGEVLQSSFPSTRSVRYDFFVGVSDRPIRHKLFSIEVGLLFDYPVTIVNEEADTTIHIDEAGFPEEIRRLFNSEETQVILGRLLQFANH